MIPRRIYVEQWMYHYNAQLVALLKGVRSVEMRGHVYVVCTDCFHVVKVSGWSGGLHFCV